MFNVLLGWCRERTQDSHQSTDQTLLPPPHNCFQDKYLLAALDKEGLCTSYFLWFSALLSGGWDPSYLSIILMLKNRILQYSIISLVRLLKFKRKKERNLISHFKSKVNASFICNSNSPLLQWQRSDMDHREPPWRGGGLTGSSPASHPKISLCAHPRAC